MPDHAAFVDNDVSQANRVTAAWLTDINDAAYGPYPAGTLGAALADTAGASNGTTLLGWLRAATGTVATTLKRLLGWRDFNVMEFMSDAMRADVEAGTALVDVSSAINAAITAAGSGGCIELPPYPMLCTSPILAEGKRGLTIRGKKGQFGWNGSRLICSHTGKAGLSLVGSLFCRLDGFIIEGATASRPKCGLLLGRSSAASASNHTIIDVNVQGYYAEVGTAIIASEENTWINCYLVPTAARVAGVLISPADGQTLNGATVTFGGLTASSMECNTFIGGAIGNVDSTAGTTGLYIDCGASTGHHHFYGTFMTKHGGDSFVTIRLGAIDGNGTEFPIGFHNVVGEHGATQPTNGIHFLAAGSHIIAGLEIENVRFQTPATNHILCDGGGTVYMIGAKIRSPYRAAGRLPSTFHRMDACDAELFSESAVTISHAVGSRIRTLTAVVPTITTNTNNYVLDMAGTVRSRFGELTGSATYDPGSLADGAGVTTTVTVTGAVANDYVIVSFARDLQGITMTGWVSAADTVSVRFQNETGGVLDLASGTILARVIKQ